MSTRVSDAGPGRLRGQVELWNIARIARERFDDSDKVVEPGEVLAWAGETFGDRLAVACSMANTVLPQLTARYVPGVDVLFLDTGYHFAATRQVRDELATRTDLRVIDISAAASREQHEAVLGPRPFETDPELCCRFRKVEPLRAGLRGYEAWVTGLRREDTVHRATASIVEWDDRNAMVKINPLVAWTHADVLAWARTHGALTNPLHDDGYPSIGCEPCTERVLNGADPRSGRWAGKSKTECGIHL